MLQLLLVVLLIVHGMIHYTGLIRAFLPSHVPVFTTYINKPTGIEWALAGTLFIVSGVLLGLGNERWWMAAAVALAFSQVLILFNWHDARFGTVANVILAIAVYFGAMVWDFHARYTTADNRAVDHALVLFEQRVSEQDLTAMPQVLFTGDAGTILQLPRATFIDGLFTLHSLEHDV